MPLNPRIDSWSGRTAWLVGASSGIGRATAERLHARGARVVVSARSAPALDEFVAAHAGSDSIALDVTDREAMRDAAARVVSVHGRLDMVVYCAATYAPMRAEGFDLEVALRHLQVNYVGALHLLDAVLPQLRRQRRGHLSLMASVAGYRGLPKALAYGPTKAALNNLAEILYLDLHDRGLGVSVINPGFVDTPMTAGNDFAMPALMQPDAAARAILAGWAAGRYEMHFPRRFTLLMKLLRHLGERSYFFAVRRVTQP